MKMMDLFKFLDVSTAPNTAFGNFIRIAVPPLVVIAINNILLYLIDYAAYWEKHTTHSSH